MRIRQIIYKNHLLPPFIKPFKAISTFLQMIHPQLYSSIKNLRQDLKIQKIEQKRSQFIKINQTINIQLINYRLKYIEPLKNCPNYYQILHKKTTQQIGQNFIKNTYEDIYKRINKQKILNQFLFQYIQFKKKAKDTFLKQTTFIPICIYTSAQQISLKAQKQWLSLSQQEKNIYQTRFISYIQKYHKQLKQHADQSRINLALMLKLMKDQIDQPLDTQTRTILFPQQ